MSLNSCITSSNAYISTADTYDSEQKKHKKFLFTLLMTFTIPLLLSGIINYFVDPYDIFHVSKYEGFNLQKPGVEKHMRLYRAVDLSYVKPKAILLGSSRVHAGFDESDWQEIIHTPTYNAGFGGANFKEIYAYFEHALYLQPQLTHVILGIDLFGFNKNLKQAQDFSKRRLMTTSIPWDDLMKSLLYFDSLCLSIQTVYDNYKIYRDIRLAAAESANTVSDDGNSSSSNVKKPPERRLLIKEMGEEVYLASLFEKKGTYDNFEIADEWVELFQKVVAICQERNIELKVFICPAQAAYWRSLDKNGLGPALADLKGRLSAIYPLWDFSGSNSVTTLAKETPEEPFYYECSHFRPVVGKFILDKMYGLHDEFSDFGVLLGRGS